MYFKKASFHRPSFLHLVQLGRKRRLKHSSQSLSAKFGRVAPKSINSGFAMLRISTQFCLGTHECTESVRKQTSYSPDWLSRLPRMGFLHGLSAVSDEISRSRLDRQETLMRERRLSSLRMSAISSTGKDSKVRRCEFRIEENSTNNRACTATARVVDVADPHQSFGV